MYVCIKIPVCYKFLVVCPGFSIEGNTYCDCEGDCLEQPEWCSCPEAKHCCKQNQHVVCPGFSLKENTYCDCEGDCLDNPKWCSCAEAKDCCKHIVKSNLPISNNQRKYSGAFEMAFKKDCRTLSFNDYLDNIGDILTPGIYSFQLHHLIKKRWVHVVLKTLKVMRD